jgi:hypothetical protein
VSTEYPIAVSSVSGTMARSVLVPTVARVLTGGNPGIPKLTHVRGPHYWIQSWAIRSFAFSLSLSLRVRARVGVEMHKRFLF